MNTRKRSPRFAFLLPALCLALAAPALSDDSDEGQDPPDSTEFSATTGTSLVAVPLDLATGTVNLLLQVALL